MDVLSLGSTPFLIVSSLTKEEVRKYESETKKWVKILKSWLYEWKKEAKIDGACYQE